MKTRKKIRVPVESSRDLVKGQVVGLGLEPHRAATQPSNVTELWQNKSEKRNSHFTRANRFLLNKYDPTIVILLRQEMVNEGYSL